MTKRACRENDMSPIGTSLGLFHAVITARISFGSPADKSFRNLWADMDGNIANRVTAIVFSSIKDMRPTPHCADRPHAVGLPERVEPMPRRYGHRSRHQCSLGDRPMYAPLGERDVNLGQSGVHALILV